MKRPRSIYSPLGLRVYGVVHLIDGIALLLTGRLLGGGGWTYRYALWGAKRRHRMRTR